MSYPPLSKEEVDSWNVTMPLDFYNYITTVSSTINKYMYPVHITKNTFNDTNRTIKEICEMEFFEDNETYTCAQIKDILLGYRGIRIGEGGCVFSHWLDLDTGKVYYVDGDRKNPLYDALLIADNFTEYINGQSA